MSEKNDQQILVEIDQLNTKLKKHPKNLSYLCRLASLHLDDNKISRSRPHMINAIQVYKEAKDVSLKQTMELSDVIVKFWKAEKNAGTKQDLRVNFSSERDQCLQQAFEIAKLAISKQDSEFAHLLSLKMAYVKECKGDFQGALALLSDLIAAQAMDNVDLSYIIFKAAVILMHIGQPKQAIEYLEFIMDDPPAQDGFTKTHLLAFLTHVYEQSGEKYRVFLPKSYKELQQCFAHDMPAACSRLMRLQGRAGLGQGSELWETLAVQALERCEYVLAAEFLAEAVTKAPGKVKLLQLLAEVSALLREKERARVFAEQAYAVSPQSAEVRNLLLQVAPEVWADRLRQLSSTSNARSAGVGEADGGEEAEGAAEDAYAPPPSALKGSTGQAVAGGGRGEAGAARGGAAPPASSAYLSAESEAAAAAEGAGWLGRMKTKASGALKAINATAPAASPVPKGGKTATPAGVAGAGPGAGSGVGSALQDGEASPAKANNITRASASASEASPSARPAPVDVASFPTKETQQEAVARPKSRSSFISMLMPGSDRSKSPNTGIRASVAATAEEGREQEQRAQQAFSPARPHSRGSFLSMLMPDPDRTRSPNKGKRASVAAGAAPQEEAGEERALEGEGEGAQQAFSPARPQSRSSFISRLLPDPDRAKSPGRGTGSGFLFSLLPASFLSSGASADASSGSSKRSSPAKAAPTPLTAATAAATATAGRSGSRGSLGKTTQQQQQQAQSRAAPSKVPSKPKAKKITKYDTAAHASRLSVEAASEGGKPERPVISRDERHMLDLILSGNENIPVYDPNLLVLQQLRASSKMIKQAT